MDKRIYSILQHSLFESLFSDIIDDNYYDYDDAEKEETKQAEQGEEVIQDMRLTDCVSREDVQFYLQDSSGLGELIRQIIWKIKDVCYGRDYSFTDLSELIKIVCSEINEEPNNCTLGFSGWGSVRVNLTYMDLNYEFRLQFEEDRTWITIPELGIKAKQFYLKFDDKYGQVGPFIFYSDGGQKFSDAIRDYVDSQIDDTDIVNLIYSILDREFNVNKIVTELTIEPKPYVVTQKDITRMANIIRQGKGTIQGFNAITKADKMVARLAAYFICADHFNIKTDQLKNLDEEALLRIFTDNSKNRSRNRRSSAVEDLCSSLNRDIFQGIHLADVLLTYKKYKDRNWDFVSNKVK